jgi:hypothetical protein
MSLPATQVLHRAYSLPDPSMFVVSARYWTDAQLLCPLLSSYKWAATGDTSWGLSGVRIGYPVRLLRLPRFLSSFSLARSSSTG